MTTYKNRFLALFLFFNLLFLISAGQNKTEKVYVGTFTSEGAEGVYLCSFSNETGELNLEKTFPGFEDPSYFRISPDRKKIYIATRDRSKGPNADGSVNAYRIQDNGELTFINRQSSNGAGPCYVDVSPDGNFVAVANYGGGTTALYRVNREGGLNPSGSVIVNEGSGPDQRRQNAPHAHSICFSPDGKQAFSADLGTDRLAIFDIKKNKLIPAKQEFVKLHPGAGPRHFTFHANGEVIYVINELNSTITAFHKNGKRWQEIQTISTLPEDFSGESFCADIHVSADGKYLYGSNRGHNSIAQFKIHPVTHRLEWVTSVSTLGDWPRNFTLSPNGKFLLVANQRSGNIVVFNLDPKTGIPRVTGKQLELPSPVCLEFL